MGGITGETYVVVLFLVFTRVFYVNHMVYLGLKKGFPFGVL